MSYPGAHDPLSIFLEGGADPSYRKELARCLEFTLFEYYRPGGPREVQLSGEIRLAYDKLRYRTSDKTKDKIDGKSECNSTPSERIELAHAIERLAGMGQCPPGDEREVILDVVAKPLATLLIDTLGAGIAKMLENTDKSVRGEDMNRIVGQFKNALRAVETDRFNRIRNGEFPVGYVMICHAVSLFRAGGERPTKRAIRRFLESLGYEFRGKNANKTWADQFNKVGLGDLPES